MKEYQEKLYSSIFIENKRIKSENRLLKKENTFFKNEIVVYANALKKAVSIVAKDCFGDNIKENQKFIDKLLTNFIEDSRKVFEKGNKK